MRASARTGAFTPLPELSFPGWEAVALASSEGGRRAALWMHRPEPIPVTSSTLLVPLHAHHWRLSLWTEGDGWSTVVDATFRGRPAWTAFSPDGTGLAYQFGPGWTFLVDLP